MEFSRQEHWSAVAFPFPRGFSQPRDQTRVSCIAGRFFTIRATNKSQLYGCKRCKLKSSKGFFSLLSLSGVQDVEARTWWVLWCEIPDFLGSSTWSPDQLFWKHRSSKTCLSSRWRGSLDDWIDSLLPVRVTRWRPQPRKAKQSSERRYIQRW